MYSCVGLCIVCRAMYSCIQICIAVELPIATFRYPYIGLSQTTI